MQCNGSQYPSPMLVEGAGCARVSVPPASWCHALVVKGVVRHQPTSLVAMSAHDKLIFYLF